MLPNFDVFEKFEKLLTENSSPGIRPGLARIERLLGLIGNPQDKFSGIHVVGTNGKGSTCAFMNSILISAGYKTAFYSSPHLENPNERLLINNEPLDIAEWIKCGEDVVRALKSDTILCDDPPSYFEILTAVAFKLIENHAVDVAVVEAGLGGRLDATNTMSKILATVITSISMDHTEFLGDTLEKIAAEKFAVVRDPNKAIYLGDSPALCKIYDKNVKHILLRDAEINAQKISLDGNYYHLILRPGISTSYQNLKTTLIGEYQIYNSALAIAGVLLSGLDVSERDIRVGLLRAKWIGRMEIISHAPLVIMDGGHNEDGVAKLVASLKKFALPSIGVVYAAMRDKDLAGCLSHLSELSPSLHLTCVPGNERSATPGELEKIAQNFAWRKISTFGNPIEAVEASKKENATTIICGSLYFVGHLRKLIL